MKKKATPKKSTKRSTKVENFEPTKVTFVISVISVLSLTLFSFMGLYFSK